MRFLSNSVTWHQMTTEITRASKICLIKKCHFLYLELHHDRYKLPQEKNQSSKIHYTKANYSSTWKILIINGHTWFTETPGSLGDAFGASFSGCFLRFMKLNCSNASFGWPLPSGAPPPAEVRFWSCICPAGVVSSVGRTGPGPGADPGPICCMLPTNHNENYQNRGD